MSKNQVSVLLATNQHLIRGNVATDGSRLLDVLNGQATEYLRLADVEVFRRYGQSSAHRLSRAVLRKASIALALRTDEAHEAPQKRVDSLVPRRTHPAFAVVLGYDIAGTVHLRGHADGVNALTLDFMRFFPVSRATVTYGGDPRQQIAARVAIVNRDFVSLLHIKDDDATPLDVSETIRQIIAGHAASEAPWTAPLEAGF